MMFAVWYKLTDALFQILSMHFFTALCGTAVTLLLVVVLLLLLPPP
jgi:hypothetical protein